MQFYNATDKQGLCQEVDRLCDSNDTSYTRADKTARINQALETVVSWIITSDGKWQFDDKNYTTLPRGTGTLTAGTAQYSFATDYLDIIEVEVKDAGGVYRKIQPIDPDELGDLSWDEYFGTTTGFPLYYDKNADGLTLGPTPSASSVTLTAGLRVTFQRKASLFTVATDTSADAAEPGFSSPFHVVLAYMASIPYCMAYKKDRVAAYMQKVGDTEPATGMKKAIQRFYARRTRDERKKITMRAIPGGFI